MKLAAETAARLQDHSNALSNGRRSVARRAEYSGSSRNTIPLIVRDTVKATAEPMMIPSRTAIGRMECLEVGTRQRSRGQNRPHATAIPSAKLSDFGYQSSVRRAQSQHVRPDPYPAQLPPIPGVERRRIVGAVRRGLERSPGRH